MEQSTLTGARFFRSTWFSENKTKNLTLFSDFFVGKLDYHVVFYRRAIFIWWQSRRKGELLISLLKEQLGNELSASKITVPPQMAWEGEPSPLSADLGENAAPPA